MIPKRIIQIWCGGGEIPLLLQAAMVNVKLLHPTFEHILLDDERADCLVRDHFPDYEATYRSYRLPIQRVDFLRYLAIHHYGGFYLDLDMFLARDLMPLLSRACVFAFEELSPAGYLWRKHRMDWQIANYAFAARPGHPFLTAIIENCARSQRDPSWAKPMLNDVPKPFRPQFSVLYTSGPGLVSRTFAENQQLSGMIEILFPADVREPRYWHRFGDFGVHNQASSWRSSEGLLLRRAQWFWYGWALRRMRSKSEQLGSARTLAAPGYSSSPLSVTPHAADTPPSDNRPQTHTFARTAINTNRRLREL